MVLRSGLGERDTFSSRQMWEEWKRMRVDWRDTSLPGKGSGRFSSPKMTDTVRRGRLPLTENYFEAQVHIETNNANDRQSVNAGSHPSLNSFAGTLYSLPI